MRDNLRIQTRARCSEQVLLVVQVDRGGHFSEVFDSFGSGLLEGLSDDGRVDAYVYAQPSDIIQMRAADKRTD